MTSVDPTQAERIPACSGLRDGKEVKKSQESRGAPSRTIWPNSARNVSTPTISASTPTVAKIRSQRLWAAMRARISRILAGSLISVDLAVTLPQQMPQYVEEQRHQGQRQSGSENRLIADGAVRQVTQRNLHDVGGNGRCRLQRVPRKIGLHAGCNGENHGLPHRTGDAQDVRR